MTTYVGFLRAINLGASRKFPKDVIVAAVESLGFAGVATHINTGNVRFDTSMRSRARIEAALEKAFREAAGFEVPTIVMTPAELREALAHAEAFGHGGRHYVSFLKQEPDPAQVAAIEARSSAEEVARVGGRAVHLMLGENYHEARLTNAVVERHLGVATNRNLTVLRAIVDKWC
ncbi:DUF1697 domain-containing protein [Nocardioides sp. dk4132]|uniref:DUF1697 domain-containing protein n=1 Tax=unclassified Nocardioides TaxID=2615069 RepID=UPI00129685A3|nr:MULTISPECIES: DUF1697 domain-containing protein [unclassified Nocardioides]MQW76876.1 DUF1697 domain-containing protein [Nocardioides sp. dk4132]QGA06778.1 DUF1697 domain-containing protein [Nocardioides sp. dk884]